MDREGAETYLRLLAEAAMRGSLAPAPGPGPPGASRMMVVGHALTAVGALDPLIAETILADFRLAVSLRQLHSDPGLGAGQMVTAAQWIGQGRAVPHRWPPPPRPRRWHRPSRSRPGMTPARDEPAGSSRSG